MMVVTDGVLAWWRRVLAPAAGRAAAWWRRQPTVAVDGALAAAVAVVTLVSVVVEARREETTLAPGGAALLALGIVPLVWRRRAPVVVMALTAGAAFAYGLAELPDPPVMFGLLLAIYTVAAYRPRRVSLACAGAVMVAAALALLASEDADPADVAVGYFSGITAWVVGDTWRGQRERAAWLDDRRADAARQAVAEERMRIARDLHDVVAHHVSVIAVQAEAAQEVQAVSPERAAKAMASVADTARAALGDLRRLLGVLRADAGLAPQPDLATIDELVESVRATGLAVTVRTRGEARPVGGLVGVTAYRVVQEALTNVVKHADAGRAEVDLAFGDDDLVVTVTDDGGTARARPRGVEGGGHGLVGMRERVTVLGGSLDAGPRPGTGFAVRARLPLRG